MKYIVLSCELISCEVHDVVCHCGVLSCELISCEVHDVVCHCDVLSCEGGSL